MTHNESDVLNNINVMKVMLKLVILCFNPNGAKSPAALAVTILPPKADCTRALFAQEPRALSI